MTKEKHEITFHHPSPQVPTDLTIQVKPDEMIWAYGLNTANFPTYLPRFGVGFLACSFAIVTNLRIFAI